MLWPEVTTLISTLLMPPNRLQDQHPRSSRAPLVFFRSRTLWQRWTLRRYGVSWPDDLQLCRTVTSPTRMNFLSLYRRHRNMTSLWRKKNKTSLGWVPRCNAGVRHFHASHRAQDNGNNYLKFDVLRSSASRQRWKPAINRKAKKREQVESTISVIRGRNGRSLPYTGRWVAHN